MQKIPIHRHASHKLLGYCTRIDTCIHGCYLNYGKENPLSHEGDLKKIRQRLHAKKRALERYGLELGTKDLKEMARLIQATPRTHAEKLEAPTLRIGIWKVLYKGRELPVAYDSKSKTIASVLPERILKKYRGREKPPPRDSKTQTD